jgi:peroxiredoxin Q/BCP
MPELEVGDLAPAFDHPDHEGKPVTLDGLRQRRLVLYFFPKADTAG